MGDKLKRVNKVRFHGVIIDENCCNCFKKRGMILGTDNGKQNCTERTS